jgi:bacteriocin-like protein
MNTTASEDETRELTVDELAAVSGGIVRVPREEVGPLPRPPE